jgi:GxxExxY protein
VCRNCVLLPRDIEVSLTFCPAWLLLSPAAMLIKTPLNTVTREIIGAAIEVHRVIGPGLLESSYMPCLQFELASRKLAFLTQQPVPLIYKGLRLNAAYRVDLIVESSVIVEIKSIESLLQVHRAQLLTYMRLTGMPAGLLINFNVPKLADGVRRLLLTVDNADDRDAPV